MSFSNRKSTTQFGVSPFFRVNVTISIGRETKTHILPKKNTKLISAKVSLSDYNYSIRIMNHLPATTRLIQTGGLFVCTSQTSAAKRRRELRLRAQWYHEQQTVAMALLEATHHSAPRSEWRKPNEAPQGQKTTSAGGKAAKCLEGDRAARRSRPCTIDGSIGVASPWIRSAIARRRGGCRVHQVLVMSQRT